jgi:hypothetical protein
MSLLAGRRLHDAAFDTPRAGAVGFELKFRQPFAPATVGDQHLLDHNRAVLIEAEEGETPRIEHGRDVLRDRAKESVRGAEEPLGGRVTSTPAMRNPARLATAPKAAIARPATLRKAALLS